MLVQIIGDPAFPLTKNVLKEFLRPQGNESEFNVALSSARMRVEQSFGVLKARFRMLLLGVDSTNIETMNYPIYSCFILHNIIMSTNEPTPDPSCILSAIERERRYLSRRRIPTPVLGAHRKRRRDEMAGDDDDENERAKKKLTPAEKIRERKFQAWLVDIMPFSSNLNRFPEVSLSVLKKNLSSREEKPKQSGFKKRE